MSSRKTIKAGECSTNIQAETINFVSTPGITREEVERIAMDTFKINFYDLGPKVDKIIVERAEEILSKYLKKMMDENPILIDNTVNPDIRYMIYEAQKIYARRGDEEVANILAEILVRRTQVKDTDIKAIVLNEAISIIPKITHKQMQILMIIFTVTEMRLKYDDVEVFIDLVDAMLKDFEQVNHITLKHLEYASCLSISTGVITFERAIQYIFPRIETIEDAQNFINSHETLNSLRNIWNNSRLCHCTLTSVGIAIAINCIRVNLDIEMDLGVLIKE